MTYDPHKHHRRSIRLPGYDYTQPGAYFVTFVAHDHECLFGDVVDGVMRLNAFGEIVRDEWFRTAVVRPYVMLNPDEFVVMPNHVHGIIWIVGAGDRGHGDDGGDVDVFAGDRGHGDDGGDVDVFAGDRGHGDDDGNVDVFAGDRGHGDDDGNVDVFVGAQRRCAPTPPTPPTPHTVRRPVGGATPTNVVPGSLGAIVRAIKSATTKRINALRGTPAAPVWGRNYYEHIIRYETSLNRIRRYIAANPSRWAEDHEHPRHPLRLRAT
jgi:putative transposase